ncbi:succinate dehydrogenase [ubiquinone] cytochrome b small subunit, mitochondrial-like [Saccoglossus kowalevskii]|uniref:Succinate dehydrogenase [ubiquinone] cytochrome b small subunit n=1 Tax=Saccoglossus kowalevskii TaxID=10224 RepID=A0ABM0GQ41_SACKO|nr:PREDICTED: succinate dehydrogenase [ubiquinone] cytochrome b small subunit, mitochondrial-like [Saccoglossus kowalevskii]
MAAAVFLRSSRAFMLGPRAMTRTFIKPRHTLGHPALLTTTIHTSPQHDQQIQTSGFLASSHWNAERVLATGLLLAFPTAFITQCPALDYVLAAGVTLHGHWGLQQIVTDYVHGDMIPKVAHASLYGLSIAAFAGLCYFNYNDVGIVKGILELWKL